MHEFAITKNTFDSGLLAGKVGDIVLAEAGSFSLDLEKRIVQEAGAGGYDLLYLRSSQPLVAERFRAVGVLHEYRGSARAVAARLSPAAGRCTVREIAAEDWGEIDGLFEHTNPTRFHGDPNLAPELVRRHKQALLKEYCRRQPAYALLAGKMGQAMGFQLSYQSEQGFHLYEICVHPTARRMPVAACLLAENLQRLCRDHPTMDTVITRIYEHNEVSSAFFNRIGLVKNGRRDYWYHAWIRSAQKGIP